MSNFPTLKTGATLQYPAQRATEFSTDVVRFIDGSEQRYRGYQAPLKRWIVQLDLLDETELHVLREFFRTESGAAESFSFTDPWDGTVYPNCSLDDADCYREPRLNALLSAAQQWCRIPISDQPADDVANDY
jgi:phage-related protein